MFVILSYQRSGTHMLASLLNSHPDLRCYDEVMLPEIKNSKYYLGKKDIFDLKENEGCILMYGNFLRSTKKIDGFAAYIQKNKVIHLIRKNIDDHIKSLCKATNEKFDSDKYNFYKTKIERERRNTFKYNFRNLYTILYEEICNNHSIENYENPKLLEFLNMRPYKMSTYFSKGHNTYKDRFANLADQKDMVKMKTISQILTDRKDGPRSTDKNRNKRWGHWYGPAYDLIFKSFDRNGKLDIIEIGTEYGASLLAWKEFFPNANVTGVDIVDKVEDKHPNIQYIISDVKNLKFNKEFDIVIDDGSHRLSDVLYTVTNFKLKVGGVMVIEDCQAPAHWFEGIKKRTKYSIETIDLRSINKQHDDFLIVLRNYGYYQ